MKVLMILLYFLSCTITGKAQYENDYREIDRIALNIPASQTNTTADIAAYIQSHFDTDAKKVRAIYTWVASNLKYDADSLHLVILDEDREEKVTYAMRRKKGVCENFAAIFDDICKKSGLRSFAIEGYTRQNGSMDRSGHAWCAAFIDNKWALYDPTWDAGFENNGQLTGNTNTNYFRVSPLYFIQSHMPFDPMFQFLDYPLTYKEFHNGTINVNNNKPYFNYADSITAFEKLNPYAQYVATALRIEKNGAPTPLIATKLKQLRMEMEIIYQDKDADLYNSAVADYTAAIANFKIFLNYRNNRFTPAKPIPEIEAMLDAIEKQIAGANNKLNEVNRSKATLALNTGDVEKVLNDLSTKVKEQQVFLRNYLGTQNEK